MPMTSTAGRVRHPFVAMIVALAVIVFSAQSMQAAEDVWADLKPDVFGDKDIGDGSNWLALEAPYRAHDAAIVPIKITALKPQEDGRYIKTITLIIDKNPAPVAAVFRLAPESGIASVSTRVRVNAYSDVRAVAETDDGKLYMVSRFVKASGGCAAPSSKNQAESLAQLGRMKLRQYSPIPSASKVSSRIHEAQLMIRHPNASGLQMDQITGYYIPAHFVDTIEIRHGGKMVLAVEGAISLSEDPTVRFHYIPKESGALSVRVEDTGGNVFEKDFAVSADPVTN